MVIRVFGPVTWSKSTVVTLGALLLARTMRSAYRTLVLSPPFDDHGEEGIRSLFCSWATAKPQITQFMIRNRVLRRQLE
jgi:hypothetical protein